MKALLHANVPSRAAAADLAAKQMDDFFSIRDAGGEIVGEAKYEYAKLFAAAPELFDALEAWAEWAVNRDVPFELISATRLALAKARGKSL